MGKYDKDRFQKELAVRYCLVRKMIPFLEVIVPSISDLSDSVEVLTDLDVVGVEIVADGEFRRTLFDCKTTNKMSSVNRAFWAAGVMEYSGCDQAYVVLKTKAVNNHRLSALSMKVDLHTEASFIDLGRSLDAAFPRDYCYQSSIDNWNGVYGCYEKNDWAAGLYDLNRNIVPLTKSPSGVFRRYIAELRAKRGSFDPAKDFHIAIFLDSLASLMVLWAALGRDARRFYEPTMSREEFERTLRYYMWGGKESYQIRQQMRDKAVSDNSRVAAIELPAWEQLVAFVGLVISAPQDIFECAHACREMAFRLVNSSNTAFDTELTKLINTNTRIKQFSSGLTDYLVLACGLPKDLGRSVQLILFGT